jgi:hypothetical protein
VGASSKDIAESPAHLSVSSWLEAKEVRFRVHADGADLRYEGDGPQGPVEVTALSPFRADAGVVAMCAPSLVRAEVGGPGSRAAAWAPAHWPGGTLAFFGATESWCGGVLHTIYDPLEGQSETGGREPVREHPHVDRLLWGIDELARLDWPGRRSLLSQLTVEAASSLSGARNASAKARKAALTATCGVSGAAAGGALALVLGLASPVAVPIAAGVGLVGGIGLGLHAAIRAARIRLWPVTRGILEAVESSEVFRKASLSAESHAAWRCHVMAGGSHRDLSLGALRADNRIEAEGAGSEVHLTIDTFRFAVDGDPDPRGQLVPVTWAVARLRVPEAAGIAELGRLAPVSGSQQLVGWFDEEALARGALHDEVLGPLGMWVRQAGVGPYR